VAVRVKAIHALPAGPICQKRDAVLCPQDGYCLITPQLRSLISALSSLLTEVSAILNVSQEPVAPLSWSSAATAYCRTSLACHLLALATSQTSEVASPPLLPPHTDPLILAIHANTALPAATRRVAMASMRTLASSGGAALLAGPEPWSMASMLRAVAAGDAACCSSDVACAAFMLALQGSQPATSPIAALPLALTSRPHAGHAALPPALHRHGARQLFTLIFDSAHTQVSSAARQQAIQLLRDQPWAAVVSCALPSMELFLCAIALGLRTHGKPPNRAPCIEKPGLLLQLALSRCGAAGPDECMEFIAPVAMLEQRAAPQALADGSSSLIVPELQRLCTQCAPEAFRWHSVAVLTAWWLQGPLGRGALLWMLAKKLTHNDLRVEAAAADALQAAAHMHGTPVSHMLVHNSHVMREAGLHAASHPQVRFALHAPAWFPVRCFVPFLPSS
jgi:hypothetical protein